MRRLEAEQVDLDGTRLIEASAGTGKTYTITTLYLRLVMEQGLDVSEILVVTYTNAATAELRERIRSRLRQAAHALALGLVDGGLGSSSEDEVLDQLVAASLGRGRAELEHRRLLRALRGFDEASVFTIHGFCQRVLHDNAFESGVPFETELASDQGPLLAELVDDFWSRELYAAPEAVVQFLRRHTLAARSVTPELLGRLVQLVVAQPDMPVLPEEVVADLTATISPWSQAVDAARSIWLAEREDILALVSDADVLKQTSYKSQKVLEQWGPLMDAAFAAPEPGLTQSVKCFHYFTPADLEKGTKRGQQTPEHAFFRACEELAEQDSLYEAALRDWLLKLELDLTRYARSELARRKEAKATQSFDDLLHSLVAALRAPGGEALAMRVRERFAAALIDEFQDTDPVQYEIFRRIWHGDGRTLFVIGDPKQAIYGFRGADVFAYMEAKRDAGEDGYTLDTNWRSGPALIDAVNALFTRVGRPFVYDEIPFHPARPAPGAADALSGDLAGDAPLRLLFAAREEDGKPITKKRASELIPSAIAIDIERLLVSSTRIGGVPVEAGDVAVLCRTNYQAKEIHAALRRRNIPSVRQGDESVFDGAEADELERLLQAVAEPSDLAALRSALATSLMGLDAGELYALDQAGDAWDPWLSRFHGWHDCWLRDGTVQLLHRLFEDHGTGRRLLARPGGERRLTNLRHLAELLQGAAQEGGRGPQGLIGWLRRMRSDAAARGDLVGDEALVRLESDALAVQIVTVHRSKGLEYPIVYCPYMWDGALLRKVDQEWVRFHDPAEDWRLTLDLGSPDHDAHARLAEQEAFAENLRLLYVALTRARDRLIVVWGAFASAQTSPLAHLLHPPESDGQEPVGVVEGCKAQLEGLDDAALRSQLASLERESGGSIAVEDLDASERVIPQRSRPDAAALRSRPVERVIASTWRTSSFSGLVASAPDGAFEASAGRTVGVANAALPARSDDGEANESAKGDHPEALGHDYDARMEPPWSRLAEARSDVAEKTVRLYDFPAGAGPGTMIHEIFEQIDFEQIDFAQTDRAALLEGVAASLRRHGLRDSLSEVLCAAIADVCATPLGGDASDFTLSQLPPSKRLDELEFTLPVGVAADSSQEAVSPARLADVFSRHATAPAVIDYASRIGRLSFTPLAGHLRGFIDLVFEHAGRWYVVDYKSNLLGPSVDDYQPERLVPAMVGHDYVLQYHLYTVALHRYLALRLPSYSYAEHMGGVYYLFLRGMAPDHPAGSGVYHDRPPEALTVALSQLFGGSDPAESAP